MIASMVWYQGELLRDQLRQKIEANYLESKSSELTNYIELAKRAIKHVYELKPGLSREEAQEKAKNILTNLKFDGKNGYYFVYDLKGTTIVHPEKPEWIGKNKWDYQDSSGKYVIRDLIQIVQENKEGGFYDYTWDKPSLNELNNSLTHKSKIAYVIALPEWEWMLGTGIYRDDVDSALSKIDDGVTGHIENSMIWVFVIALISLLIVGVQQRVVGKNIGKNTERLRIIGDLHDSVKQDLTFIIRELKNKADGLNYFDTSKIITTAQKALNDLRNIIYEETQQPISLEDSLIEVVNYFILREEGLPVDLQLADDISTHTICLNESKKKALIKVTEGAFQNISDHAAAKRVIVKLYADEQNLYLVIQDDGIGFDVNSVKLRGIQNMKSRIKEISSRLLIESSPTGTTITAIVKKNH